MERNPSPQKLGEQDKRREAFGMETIRSMIVTVRSLLEQVSKSEASSVEVNSLQDLNTSTTLTITSVISHYWPSLTPSGRYSVKSYDRHSLLNQLHRTGKRIASLPKLNNRHARREGIGVEVIYSAVDTIHAFLEDVPNGESDIAATNSLQDLRGSMTASVSNRSHQTTNPIFSRRNVIQTAGYTAIAIAFGATLQAASAVSHQTDRDQDTSVANQDTAPSHDTDQDQGTAVSHDVNREQHTILDGTQYETTIHTITSPNDGPTAMVFGGVHGNERGGIEAAHLATNYTIDRGTLIVSPETNKVAVEMDGNHGPDGDLNRQFPVGEEPTTKVARGVWNEILRSDPAFLIDMHNATTLMSRGSVGQGIFPTSGVIEEAENAAAALNERYLNERIRGDLPEHALQVGNTVTEDRPRMNHKAAADQNIEGWSSEVTRIDLTLDERTFLHDMLTRELLSQIGINVVSDPEMTNPL